MTIRSSAALTFDGAGSGAYPIANLADIASWSWAMDSDYDPATTVKLTGDAAGISAGTVTDGGATYTEIAIPMPVTLTTELAEALGSKEELTLNGELCGYTADARLVFVMQIKGFTVRNRIAGSGTATPVDSGYITATQAAAMFGARQNTASYSSGAEVNIPGKVSEYLACISGGVTASAAPSFNNLSVGKTVTDGTVTWRFMRLVTQGEYVYGVDSDDTYSSPYAGRKKVTLNPDGVTYNYIPGDFAKLPCHELKKMCRG